MKTPHPKKKLQKRKTKPVGRPTKYRPKYCQAIIDYFDILPTNAKGVANDLPFILNFCLSIGINKTTLHEWVGKFPEFSNAYRIAKGKQMQHLITNTLQNRFNASFAWRAAMNMFEWREKSDNIHTGKDGEKLFPDLSDADLDVRIAAIIDER